MKKNEIQILAQNIKALGSANNPPSIIIGEVLNSNPLKVRVNKLELEADDIMINPDITVTSGDKVAVLPMDSKKIIAPMYIVFCKVVKAG